MRTPVLLAATLVCMACSSTPASHGTGGTGGAQTTGTGGSDAGHPLLAGSPCTADADCADGACLTEPGDGFPRGYCTGKCVPSNPSTCTDPTQAICIPDSTPGEGMCRAKCSPSMPTSCGDGYACVPLGSKGYCSPACTADAQCPTVGTCNTASGLCKP